MKKSPIRYERYFQSMDRYALSMKTVFVHLLMGSVEKPKVLNKEDD